MTVTTDEINRIIEYSKANGRKSICFVTGVPGSGKTLVGLNIAVQRSDAQAGEHAVFLSGNFPLVTVLQEALARDKVEQEKQRGNRVAKADALRSTSAFIQIIHKYRDFFVRSFRTPDLAAFVKAVLDADTDEGRVLYQRIKDKYPIVITRDLNKAKTWVRDHCQGTTRYGLLASSGGLRLKPEGIFVKNKISVANWFRIRVFRRDWNR